jgi:exportin-2 (importin alpha re-exporter)
MELSEGNLQALAGYLQQTLSPDPTVRKAGEKFLESIERNQNYPLLLLQLIDQDSTVQHIRVSAAITVKNYVKRNWKISEDEGDKIHENDRSLVKQHIVGLMLKSPEQIQKQLSDAIAVIGHEDFPDKWPDLIKEMVSKFETGDFHLINGVLHTAHSLFKRYRHEFKSQSLWTEIKFVLDNFAAPLTQLFNATVDLARVHAENREALTVIYSSLLLISKIFYSLNCQDLPEFFEDNMSTWMNHFHSLLTTDCKLLDNNSEEEPGLVEQLRTQVCDNITMYAQKYDEEFAPHLPRFVTAVWNLLTTLGNQLKYDLLVSNAIVFLASVAERVGYRQLFEDPATLASICEKIIVPNMQFRAADEEVFEDNAEEYIRRDIEGSDVDTRRRAACDLVRALSKSFESLIIQNFSAYIQHMLSEYSHNPGKNWKDKDAAIFLVTSLAVKAQTQKHGITQTSDLVNIVDFYHSHIDPDLRSNNINECPVLKADAIKYLMIFRTQLPREVLLSAVRPLVQLLTADSQVVHSYAACCIEKILLLNTTTTTVVSKSDLSSVCQPLLTNLFQVLSRQASQENEHVMKAITRCLWTLQELFIPHVAVIVTQLTDKLLAVSKASNLYYYYTTY